MQETTELYDIDTKRITLHEQCSDHLRRFIQFSLIAFAPMSVRLAIRKQDGTALQSSIPQQPGSFPLSSIANQFANEESSVRISLRRTPSNVM